MNKTELLDMLYEDIYLEKKVCLVLPALSRVFVRSRPRGHIMGETAEYGALQFLRVRLVAGTGASKREDVHSDRPWILER